MLIKFSPQRSDDSLVIDVVQEGLVINGVLYDLTEVTDDLVPVGAILNGTKTEVTLRLPLSSNPSPAAAFPEDTDVSSGAVLIPDQTRPTGINQSLIPQEIRETVKVQNKPSMLPSVPAIVTMRQARLALLNAGKLALIDPAIEALPEPQKTAAKIEWEYSQEVHRDKPFVQVLAQAVGLNDTQLDELFIQAASL